MLMDCYSFHPSLDSTTERRLGNGLVRHQHRQRHLLSSGSRHRAASATGADVQLRAVANIGSRRRRPAGGAAVAARHAHVVADGRRCGRAVRRHRRLPADRRPVLVARAGGRQQSGRVRQQRCECKRGRRSARVCQVRRWSAARECGCK